MEKLEIFQQFKNKFGKQLNPELCSVKYYQSSDDAEVELYFNSISTPTIINLDFIRGELVRDENGNEDMLPLFNPEADIVDNATCLLELDAYSLMVCIDKLFSKEAAEEINEAYLKGLQHS